MPERIQRTEEGLSLVDPFASTEAVVAQFPQIIISYSQLPTISDNEKEAVALINRRDALEEGKFKGTLPDVVESLILETDASAKDFIAQGDRIDRYKQAIGRYGQTIKELKVLDIEETDQRFARMWFFERISNCFYQIDAEKGDNQACIQATIACVYSDFELGAKDLTISRGRNAMSTVYSFSYEPTRELMKKVLVGDINELPQNWSGQTVQELSQILKK